MGRTRSVPAGRGPVPADAGDHPSPDRHRNPFSILTKGTLILRDLELLVEAAGVTDVSTAFSIGTLDEDAWRASEPGTSHPRARIDAVRR